MPSFEAWREHLTEKALETERRIGERAVEIRIRRGGEMLGAQTVRVELGNTAREDLDVRRGLGKQSLPMTPGVQRAVVFGVRDHPTAADTDIGRGDRFVLGETEFEVSAVVVLPGEVQAFCEART